MWKRILLATDGTPKSRRAEELAFDLARATQAELLVVSVAHAASEEDRGSGMREAMDTVSQVAARGRALGLQLEAAVERGEPAQAIVAAAQARNADVVVMGTEGKAGLTRALLGSVAETVARNSPVTVIIAK